MTIKIDFKILVCILTYILFKQYTIYLLMILFGILHEMGHLMAGILLGLKPKQITIMPLGISLEFEYAFIKLIKIKELLVAASGPLVNLFFVIISSLTNNESNIIFYVFCTNVIMLLFNLVPIYPLDGGRILKAILHMKCGYKKSIIITNFVSNINTIMICCLCIFVSIFTKTFSILFVMVYLLMLTNMENKKYK